ncbi:MAG: F0F1 ATP synthase subunit epsilon [Propionibacteriaceae bacterium]|jgi:F-type H+-transporting ATPase subunit epsilon|nr:F0F1 ATP synthase subunit epsilon [Propionibacteriaceae bacterium]
MADTFWVEVVAADRSLWEGAASQVLATTTEGQIGILAHHIPLISPLDAGLVEVTAADGQRHMFIADGGFVSVQATRVAVIAPYAQWVKDIDVEEARRSLMDAQSKRDAGDNSVETQQQYRRAQAQVKAAELHTA